MDWKKGLLSWKKDKMEEKLRLLGSLHTANNFHDVIVFLNQKVEVGAIVIPDVGEEPGKIPEFVIAKEIEDFTYIMEIRHRNVWDFIPSHCIIPGTEFFIKIEEIGK